jgi:hypothetical protein
MLKVIAYDMHRERPGWQNDRDKLLAHLQRLGEWARLSESCYALRTAINPAEIKTALAQYLDANDQLYVITLTAPWNGWGPQVVNQWLTDRLRPAT